MRSARGAWIAVGVLLVALAALRRGPPDAGAAAPRAGPVEAPAAPALSLRWASIEYYLAGPTDPVVEVRVIVGNRAQRPSDSTSILWDPAFAQHFVFLRSEPAAWRARIDEQGWGVLDTAGVLPGQHGTFRLWFAINTYAAQEPRLVVVADGGTVVGEAVATATHLKWQADPRGQRTFERGALAAVADAAGLVPADARGAFPLAAGLGVVLAGVTLAGSAAAIRLVTPRAPPVTIGR